MAPLRTDVLATILLERVLVKPMTEPAAVMLLESRAPGRACDVIQWAEHRGMVRRIPGHDDEPAMIAPPVPAPGPVAA
jgi:hypothetical protein